MAKISKYYAVKDGKSGTGIYLTWEECEAEVKGQKGGVKYKKFSTETEALDFCNGKVASEKPYAAPLPRFQRRASPIPEYNPKQMTVVYADGSALGNGQKGAVAGAGVYFGDGDPRNMAYKLPENESQTNQRAELTAAILALQHGQPDEKTMEIRTDSKYVINGATDWHKRWLANDFKTAAGAAVLHEDLWRRIIELINARPGKVYWKHVKGHSGDHGNDAADKLAREGALKIQ